MNKWKLIEITLEQLSAQWEHNKDLFDCDSLDDELSVYSSNSKDPYISWEPPKVDKDEQQQLLLINKKIKITYSKTGKHFKCEILNVSTLSTNKLENHIIAKRFYIPIRKLYKDFISLRKEINEYKGIKESNKYLNDLCKVFPGTLDDILLGSDNE